MNCAAKKHEKGSEKGLNKHNKLLRVGSEFTEMRAGKNIKTEKLIMFFSSFASIFHFGNNWRSFKSFWRKLFTDFAPIV